MTTAVSEPLFGGYQTDTTRWAGHDYAAPGWTFVTVCTADRTPALGHVENGIVHLSEVGRIADATFRAIGAHDAHVVVDAVVVMPDHVHVLLGVGEAVVVETRHGASSPPPGASLTLDRHPGRVAKMDRGVGPTAEETRHGASLRSDVRTLIPAAPQDWIPPAPPLAAPRTFGPLAAGSVSSVINQTKGAVTRAARRAGHTGFRWQPRFHDRVVRTSRELDAVRAYIAANPARWSAR